MKGTKSRYTTSSVDDIPLQARRLDSIAWLIQGDDTCGAACFDGEKLLLATNSAKISTVVTKTIDYLQYVAEKSKKLREDLDEGKEINSRKFKEKIERHSEILMKAIAESDMHQNRIFQADTKDALDKITDSVIASYIDPEGITVEPPATNTAIDPKIRHAIRKGRIEFIPGDRASNDKSIHAEMKLAQKLLEKRTSDSSAADNFYIGVSKRCCLKCHTVIKSINNVISDPIHELIAVRDGQLGVYPAGIPKFLDYEDNTLY